MQDLISIIVPVYKVEEKYLRQSINSILNQTYTNWECILIDDGSPDNCGEICDCFAELNSQIKVIHKKNAGASAARNTGLQNAKGKYITFIDSDDYVSPKYLEHLYQAISSTDANCVICGCKFVTDFERLNSNSNYELKSADRNQCIDDLCYMRHPFKTMEMTAVWGTIYLAENIKNLKFDTTMDFAEDFVFKLNLFKCIDKVIYMDSQEYGYLVRPTSATYKKFDERRMKTFYSIRDLAKNHIDSNDEYKDAVVSRCVNIAIIFFLSASRYSDNDKYSREIIEFIKEHRIKVLANINSRIKVKLALIISFFSFNFMRKIYTFIESRH